MDLVFPIEIHSDLNSNVKEGACLNGVNHCDETRPGRQVQRAAEQDGRHKSLLEAQGFD